MRYFLILIPVLFVLHLEGQVTIHGSVKNLVTKEILEGTSIVFRGAARGSILSYALTDDEGNYKAQLTGSFDSLLMTVSFMGYEEQSLKIPFRTAQFDFYLRVKEFQLKELKVKGEKIWGKGDTVNYSAAAFTTAKDRYLTDILKKMPGIEVEPNGALQYNGKPINRFYMEGMNLLDGRYTLASNNLPAEKIATVQVLENHQPINVLNGTEFSDRAALNIKFKKEAKSQWIATGDMGLGTAPFLWRADIFALRLAEQQQGLFTYKTNNAGIAIVSEINELNLEEIGTGFFIPPTASLFTSPFLSSPALSPERSFFNQSHVLSLNQLWKLNEDSNLRLNIDYMHEKQKQRNVRHTTYFLSDTTTTTFAEENQVNSTASGMNGKLAYTKNSANYYLENKLSGSGKWQKIHSKGVSDGVITQTQKLPQDYIMNQFRLVRLIKGHKFQLFSLNKYEWLPQYMEVRVTDDHSDLQSFCQNGQQKLFFSNTAIQYGHSVKKWEINYRMGYKIKITDINGLRLAGQSVCGDACWRNNEQAIYFMPQLSWNYKGLHTDLKLPLDWSWIENEREHPERLFVSPSLSVNYQFYHFWRVNLGMHYGYNQGGAQEILSDRMTDYRTLYRFDGAYPLKRSLFVSSGLSYRNPLNAFWGNIRFIYQRDRNNNISERTITGDFIIQDFLPYRNYTESFTLNGELSKVLNWNNLNIKLPWQLKNSHLSMMQKGTVTPFSLLSFSVKPTAEIEIYKKNVFTYSFEYSGSGIKTTEEGKGFSLLKTLKQHFTLFLLPTPKLHLSFSGEYYYNQLNDNHAVKIFLADAEVSYKIWKNLELNAKWNNVFNKRYFSYSYYTNMSHVSYSYQLRPSQVLFTLYCKL